MNCLSIIAHVILVQCPVLQTLICVVPLSLLITRVSVYRTLLSMLGNSVTSWGSTVWETAAWFEFLSSWAYIYIGIKDPRHCCDWPRSADLGSQGSRWGTKNPCVDVQVWGGCLISATLRLPQGPRARAPAWARESTQQLVNPRVQVSWPKPDTCFYPCVDSLSVKCTTSPPRHLTLFLQFYSLLYVCAECCYVSLSHVAC